MLNTAIASQNLSRSETCRYFKQILNTSPMQYVIDYRIKQSLVLLHDPESSVTDVGYRVGFNSTSYFIDKFRDAMNMTIGHADLVSTSHLNLLPYLTFQPVYEKKPESFRLLPSPVYSSVPHRTFNTSSGYCFLYINKKCIYCILISCQKNIRSVYNKKESSEAT
ncbi:helix-turn-helix transcriptional regulator [Paenibacillus glucanolyticus]|nr:helix-turn-helix transcriptional regulator [Paenibacillus glucanolyticus]